MHRFIWNRLTSRNVLKRRFHTPVLLTEVVNALKVDKNSNTAPSYFIDCTVGGGGHSIEILRSFQKSFLLAIDLDLEALTHFHEILQLSNIPNWSDRVKLVHGSYTCLREIIKQTNFPAQVDGIIADFGMSSWQVDQASRGFSFSRDGPLDMRFSRSNLDDKITSPSSSPSILSSWFPVLNVTASELCNHLPEGALMKIFREYGEERHSAAIARAIVDARSKSPINTTHQLSSIIKNVYGNKPSNHHPATKVFQALRITVNDEFSSISALLKTAPFLLKKDANFVAISFHSSEEKIIRRSFISVEKSNQFKFVSTLSPTEDEVNENIRARSARAHTLQRIN
jgi:16S rRNA (cytosine1402-N4)-methyltransferase